MNLNDEISNGLQHLIDASYDTGYLSAKMESNPKQVTDNDREFQKELIATRYRIKIALLGLIEEYKNGK
jgi:hypothetical protein